MPTHTCQICGETFTTTDRRKVRKFCSRKCFYESLRTKSEWRNCKMCGEPFYFKSQGPQHKGEYCSPQCGGRARRGPRPWMQGDKHPNWKGGRHQRKRDGYVSIQVRDESGKRPWQLEHRLVMEQHLGRPLDPNETVHHLNGDKADNRLENLELWSNRHPKGQRVVDLVVFAREVLALYG